MMLPMSENGIFWNVYEQECRFRGIVKRPPRFVRTTCDKLAALYPDLNEAEMFMRAQFVTGCTDIRYYLPEIVFSFKDFIMERHHQMFEEYKRWYIDSVLNMLEQASRELAKMDPKSLENTLRFLLEEANVPFDDFQSRGMAALEHLPEELLYDIYPYLPHKPNATNPLVRCLLEKDNCPQEVQERIVRDCLHFPILMNKIPLTDGLKDRIQFYKDEVRATEYLSRHSSDSKYLIDFPEKNL